MPETTRKYRLFPILAILFMLLIPACKGQVGQTQPSPLVEPQITLEATQKITPSPVSELPTFFSTPARSLELDQNAVSDMPALQALITESAYSYPESFYIKGIVGHVQVYELGCEASAAVDWANYFGKTIYEFNFQSELPISDNPDFGYVGDPNTDGWGQIPPYAYGVHSDPVADLLRAYGLPAQSKKAFTLEGIREKISQSKPVIVWIIGNMEYSVPVEYTDSQGRKSIVAPYEHVVILTGYDQNTVRYMSNGRYYDVPNDVFLTSWGVLGNMAVVHE